MSSTEATPLVVSSHDTNEDPIVSSRRRGIHNHTTASSSGPHLQRARRLLYASHLSAQCSEQAWQFGLILFLAAFTDYRSLALVSSYGLCSGLVVCVAGPAAGRYFVDDVDNGNGDHGNGSQSSSRWNRVAAAQFLIWTQNVSVLAATVCCYALLVALRLPQQQQQQQHDHRQMYYHPEEEEQEEELNWFQRKLIGVPLDLYSVMLLLGIHVFGSLAQILDKAFLVAIERDWVVVMGQVATDLMTHEMERNTDDSNSNNSAADDAHATTADDAGSKHQNEQQQHHQPSKAWLSETNVIMKQIDLSCRIAAPALAGFIIGAAAATTTRSNNNNNSATTTTTAITPSPQPHPSYDLASAALLVGLLNAVSLVVEYVCTARIYQLVPELAARKQQQQHSHNNSNSSSSSNNNNRAATAALQEDEENNNTAITATTKTGNTNNVCFSYPANCSAKQVAVAAYSSCAMAALPPGLRIYMEQPISWAGLGLALL